MAASDFSAAVGFNRTALRPRWSSRLAFPALLFLIVVGFYWKLVLTTQFDWVAGTDVAGQVLPWFEEEARQLQHGQFPLWDPHSWGGQPFLGQTQPGAAYPLNWLLWMIPTKDGHIQFWTLQWVYVATHYMAALFAYLLCRDLGRSRPASLVGGLIFALAGYVGTIDWPQMLNGAIWTPLVFLFLLRAGRGVDAIGSAALSGLFLGMTWLSGHHQVPIFLTLATVAAWTWYALRAGKPNWRMASLGAMSIACSLLAGALQILPAQEYGRLALRWVDTPQPVGWKDTIPYYVHGQFSLHPIQLLGVLIPGLDNEPGRFLGVVGFTLALLGAILCWRQPAVKFLAALAVGALFFALGGHSVFHGLLYGVVPFVEKARVPARAMFLFHTGAAVLAAFAVDQLATSPIRGVVRAVALFAMSIAAIVLMLQVSKKLQWDMEDRMMITVLAALLLAALLYGWPTGALTHPQACTLLVLLLMFELGNDTGFQFADRNKPAQHAALDKVTNSPDIAAFLHRQNGRFRVESRTDDIFLNWGDYHNLDFLQTYTGVTANVIRTDWPSWQTRMLFGVSYTLARSPVHDGQQEVFQGANGIKVYRNPDAFPRAWAVQEVIRIPDAAETRRFMNDHLDQMHSKALTAGPVKRLPACQGGAGKVEVTQYAPSAVNLAADMICEGLVVLSDTYYPGWRAEVDSKPVPIEEVNLAMRGVRVPAGHHEVKFAYRPVSVYAGAGLSGLGSVAVLLLTIFARRKRVVVDIQAKSRNNT
ncbi:MAG: YfhO family protein [Acidobacteriota bacterium]|nr:YfhO family protein [Acidobacteriota bacterium]